MEGHAAMLATVRENAASLGELGQAHAGLWATRVREVGSHSRYQARPLQRCAHVAVEDAVAVDPVTASSVERDAQLEAQKAAILEAEKAEVTA